MKYLAFLILIVVSLTSCTKDEVVADGGPDPIPPKIISRDTLTTGQLWGLTIGQSAADVYAKIQAIRIEKEVGYLGVVGNFYNSLENLDGKIPLYTGVLLDEQVGTSTGIQIYFANGKVQSIFNNSGVKMNKWPTNVVSAVSVAVGDKTDEVYSKLVSIKKMSAYAGKFERISLFSKDPAKDYDPLMSNSRLWYLNGHIADKRYYNTDLNFSNGKLVSIYTSELEY